MKGFKKLPLVILLLGALGCTNNQNNYQPFPISDLQTDFPKTDTLSFEKVNTYNIFTHSSVRVSDSTLWVLQVKKNNMGNCYHLYTGEKISSIASFGRANNEVDNTFSSIFIDNDSIYFYYGHTKTIKAFSMQDIRNNVPLGERKATITQFPDSLWPTRIRKLPNGPFLTTLSFGSIVQKQNSNQSTIALIHNNDVKTYKTINYDSYNINIKNSLSTNDFIKLNYAQGKISHQNNNMAVFSVDNQVILYTVDLTNGKVMNEKRYTEMKRLSDGFSSNNDLNLRIMNINSNEQYIFCIIEGYMNEKEKAEKHSRQMLLVFDWRLNPIKKFALPEEGFFNFPLDNKPTIYQIKENAEGFTLYKANWDF